jgi:acetoin utilization deacetylase AcuC-like enzyme
VAFTIVTSDRFSEHMMPPGHPERVARARVMRAVAADWSRRGVPVLEPRRATREELARVHSAAYLDAMAATRGRATMLDPDTFTSPRTAETAALAAGAAIVAVDSVLDDATTDADSRAGGGEGPAQASGGRQLAGEHPRAALAMVRPPGHHAAPGRAMGFCIYNNVAVAAAHALSRGAARVAIVDYDVHHGNGTQWRFYDDPRVLFASVHQFPFYPGTGSAGEAGIREGEGFTFNVPLEAHATDGDYLMVFGRLMLPVVREFRPDLILVSAGFDAHMRDPLAMMRVSVGGFNEMAARIALTALGLTCPVVFVTEGGYNLRVLAASLDGIVGAMTGGTPPDRSTASIPDLVVKADADEEPLTADDAPLVEEPTDKPTGRGQTAIELVHAAQHRYWPVLGA